MSVNGLVVMTPTSIASTGAGNSSSIGANGKVTFSSCATLSLNGVFTSSYDNYMISIRNYTAASADQRWRLRSAGVDASGNNYTYQYLYGNGTSVTAGRATFNVFTITSGFNAGYGGAQAFVFGPFLAQPTASRSVPAATSGTNAIVYDWAETHSLSTSYDGLTFFPDSGTMTGAVTIYGFNQ